VALIAVFVIVLVVPLTLTSLRNDRYERYVGATERAARNWVKGTGWRVISVRQSGDDIVAGVVGSGAPPPLQELRTAVRRTVPHTVPVQVVEGSGRTIEL
jgi:hypothetical protein